jgi:hypothetical protein
MLLVILMEPQAIKESLNTRGCAALSMTKDAGWALPTNALDKTQWDS